MFCTSSIRFVMSQKTRVLWSFQFHGGTNFGRTAGGPFITTSYDYDAPIDEYGEQIWRCYLLKFSILLKCGDVTHLDYIIGLIRQPKFGHLKRLHDAVKLCEKALLTAEPYNLSLGTYQKVCCLSLCLDCLSKWTSKPPCMNKFIYVMLVTES